MRATLLWAMLDLTLTSVGICDGREPDRDSDLGRQEGAAQMDQGLLDKERVS